MRRQFKNWWREDYEKNQFVAAGVEEEAAALAQHLLTRLMPSLMEQSIGTKPSREIEIAAADRWKIEYGLPPSVSSVALARLVRRERASPSALSTRMNDMAAAPVIQRSRADKEACGLKLSDW